MQYCDADIHVHLWKLRYTWHHGNSEYLNQVEKLCILSSIRTNLYCIKMDPCGHSKVETFCGSFSCVLHVFWTSGTVSTVQMLGKKSEQKCLDSIRECLLKPGTVLEWKFIGNCILGILQNPLSNWLKNFGIVGLLTVLPTAIDVF